MGYLLKTALVHLNGKIKSHRLLARLLA